MSLLLDLLYPPKCAFCRKPVADGRMLCAVCERQLPAPPPGEEQFSVPGLDGCLAPLYYTGTVRESLHRYKFHATTAYAGIYGELMSACVRRNGAEADLITCVPLSRRRLRKRGYDQAELLAREVARRLGLPCVRLLRKTKNNRAQSGTGSVEERRRNVEGVYQAVSSLNGESVLLIDDIVTTGATIASAARSLRESGAQRIIGLSVARTTKESNGDRDYADI